MGSISKQGLIGIAMMFGSGIILFALSEPSTTPTVNAGSEEKQIVAEPLYKVAQEVELEPLDKDVAEQAKIVQQQQQQRSEAVKAQEEKSRELLEAQEKTEKAEKAETDVTTQEEVKDSTQTEEIKKAESKPQPPAQPATYTVQEGDYLGKLASQHGMSAEVLAEANDMHVSQAVKQGQKIKIPSAQQVAKIKQKVKQNQAYRKAQIEAKKQAQQQAQAKQEKPTPAQPAKQATNTSEPVKDKPKTKAKFGIQVASGADEEGAKSVVAKLRSAGYSASTRKTGNGEYRIIVGPVRGSDEAEALKNKVSTDSRVTTKGAWVINW